MHELSYMTRLANLACETANENHAKSVKKIKVEVGAMTGVLPKYLEYYFPTVIKGTILEGSELETILIPVKAHCNNCGKEYTPTADNDYRCPSCKSIEASIIDGRDVKLKEVIVD